MKRKSKEATDSDIAIVLVAMMLAGLDGVVLPEEYVAFEDIFRLCGCSPRKVNEVEERGLELAGYMVLQSQRLPDDELICTFVDRVERLLPGGFQKLHGEDLRKAFIMWMIMIMSDGRYLAVERRGIQALKEAFNKISCQISDAFLVKCENFAAKLLSAQKLYERHPTTVNKNKCASIVRRIKAFLEVQ